RIAEYKLKVLDDDKLFFPPYDAAPIVRGELLRKHPEVRTALIALAGTISDDEMRQMNYAVDMLKREPSDVARQWLDARAGEAPPLAAVGEGNAEGNAPVSVWTLAMQRRGEIVEKTVQHLVLTVLGVLIAIV